MIRVTLAVGEHTNRWQEEDVRLPADTLEPNIQDDAIRKWEEENPGRIVAFLVLYAWEHEDDDTTETEDR